MWEFTAEQPNVVCSCSATNFTLSLLLNIRALCNVHLILEHGGSELLRLEERNPELLSALLVISGWENPPWLIKCYTKVLQKVIWIIAGGVEP
jgi:hypothetical protein